jgi:hypothetical protein
MLVLSHYSQYNQRIIGHTEYVSCFVKAGCEKYIADNPHLYELSKHIYRIELLQLLASSYNVELIENYIDSGSIGNFNAAFDLIPILNRLLHMDRHKYEIMEILKYLWKYISLINIKHTIAEYNLLQLINENCRLVEDFYYFCRITGTKDLKWVFHDGSECRVTIMDMFDHAISFNNEMILNVLIDNLSPSTDMTQALCKCISHNNRNVFYRLLELSNHKLINWTAVLRTSILAGNISVSKLACENGADGKSDNFVCIRLAIEYKRVEIAKYLWEKFPLE